MYKRQVFYLVYSLIRNAFGSAAVGADVAYGHAKIVISIERALGSFHEETVQEWFLDDRAFIQWWNLFYGTFHFVVTTAGIIWLFRKQPWRYVRWRTALAFMPAVAIAQVLPISVGGLGVREGAFVLFLGPLGVPAGQAVALGLLVYGLNLAVSLLGAPAFAVGGGVGADAHRSPQAVA